MSPTNEEALFILALSKTAAERAAWLDRECGGDTALRQRLDALLAAHEQPATDLAGADASTVKADEGIHDIDEAVGQTLGPLDRLGAGRYKLLECIGEGGCGVVYVADQTEPVRRRVALKVIKLGMDTKQVVARFEAERQALAMMDHPNIAKVLDAGTTDQGCPYFVMELVRGIKITDYCDQANLSTKDRLDLFIKVCQAIQHAHQKGIIHRDIKPSNILVTLHDPATAGVPKVIDFGIAKATEGKLTDNTVYTQLHQFMGTPAYMSPEQAEMSGLDIDTRSDIYSLGVLLYELLAGSTPFDAKELMSQGIDAMRKTIREKEPQRPSTRLATLGADELTTTAKRRSADTAKLLHQLKGDLDWIVMKCLEKDRTRRYDTANALALDIQRHLANEPVFARPPSTAYRLQKAWHRNKLVFTAASVVAIALVVGIGVSTRQTVAARRAQRDAEAAREGEEAQRREAQQKQVEAEAERQRANVQADKAFESQQLSRRLLYVADMNLAQQSYKEFNLGKARRLLDRHRPQPGEEDLRGWEWRYLWQLTRSSALVTLTNRPTTRGWSVSFSPDGSRLAVGWMDDGRVELWDVPGRRLLRALTDREQPHQGQVAFSPSRSLLAATSEPKTVRLYDLDSGQESVFWRASDRGDWKVRSLAFSPDGSKLVIYARSGDSDLGDEVLVVDVSSSKIESSHRTASSGSLYGFLGAAQLSPDNRRLYLTRQYNIECLDLAAGQKLWESESEKGKGLTTLALSPDGRVLASCSGYEDPRIRICDAATGEVIQRLQGHISWVCKLVFSKDGRLLISAATDQTIRFWDTSTWTEAKAPLRGHTDEVHAVAFSERAHLVASAGKDGNLTLWRDDDGATTAHGYHRLPEDIGDYEVGPQDQSRVLLLSAGKPPVQVDLTSDSPAVLLPEPGSPVDVLGWYGTNILCHWNETNQILVCEWRAAKFIQRGTVTLDSVTRPTGFTYNPARQLMAWSQGTAPQSIFLANLEAPDRRIELKSDVPGVLPFRFSDDGTYLAARGADTLRVWKVESGRIVATIGGEIRDAAFAADGRVVVVIIGKGKSYEVGFYDLTDPARPPRRVPGRMGTASLAVSQTGGLVAAAGGGQVQFFDPAKGTSLEPPLHGHLNPVYSIAFSPDGRRLISASGGRETAKLWDIGTRQELLTLSGTGSLLLESRWSTDGNSILAGSPWQTWHAPSWTEIEQTEAKDKAEGKQP